MGGIEGETTEGIEVEISDAGRSSQVPPRMQMRRLCAVASAAAGVNEGHVAIEFVDAERIARLNAEHRGKNGPTDVLSFPIDGAQPLDDGPRELGDVVICLEHTADVREAVVHGVLHLVGMDHETDAGEMLALQAEILRWEAIDSQADAPGGPQADAPGGSQADAPGGPQADSPGDPPSNAGGRGPRL
jgi:probable rRNA maturation factor